MDSNIELDQSYSMKSVDDLYEEMLADGTHPNIIKNVFENQNDCLTESSSIDISPSFITLKNSYYTPNSKPEQTITSFLNEQIEQIERRNSFDNETLGSLTHKNPLMENSNLARIPILKISENPQNEIISHTFNNSDSKTIQGK